MFSDPLKGRIHRQFLDGIGDMGMCRNQILENLERCSGDLRTVMEFYYGGMPAGDMGGCDFSLLRKIAESGLALAREAAWMESIPETIRLNYVLNYRIETEQIEDSRGFFFRALNGRIRGKTLTQAVLEVHRWCTEHAEPAPPAGGSFSPTGVLKSGGGDSLRLSVLEAAALRSVNIPARVVQTRAWAHGDGGLFWLEVWHDDGWSFLEPCRAEPALGRDWFAGEAARAMLITAGAFLPPEGEEAIPGGCGRWTVNVLNRYAPARFFTVTVRGGAPVRGAEVRFEVLNRSGFVPSAALKTNEEGRAGLTLGLGSVHIHAAKDGRFVQALVNTAGTDHAVLDFSNALESEPQTEEAFVMRPPKTAGEFFMPLTEIQKAQKSSEAGWAAQARKEYLAGLYQPEQADRLADEFQQPERVRDLLRKAKGNFGEIFRFLLEYRRPDVQPLKLDFLESLSADDLCGARTDVLAEHFQGALPYLGKYGHDIFIQYLMNPRIGEEPLAPYRVEISALLGARSAAIRKEPRLAWRYAARQQGRKQSGFLTAAPAGMLKTGIADETGARVLFVAVCRTFGVPARINPVDSTAEYYQKGAFRSAEAKKPQKNAGAELTLAGGGPDWVYRRDWTLSLLKNGVYQPLDFSGFRWEDGAIRLRLPPGGYRLLTAVRVPNGGIFCVKTAFRLECGESKTLPVKRHKTVPADLLENAPLPSFRLYGPHFSVETLDDLVKDKPVLLIWLEEGADETDRLLGGLVRSRAAFGALNCRIVFVIRSPSAFAGPQLVLACRELPGAQVYSADFDDTAVLTALRLGLSPGLLPLAAVVRPGPAALYAYAGYRDGLTDLLIRAVRADSGKSGAKSKGARP